LLRRSAAAFRLDRPCLATTRDAISSRTISRRYLFVATRSPQLARPSTHLKKIQDALGSLNDFVAQQKMAAEVALEAPSENRRARAFTSGVLLGREDEAVKPLVKVAIREVRGLRQVKARFG
jgi:hypothetical protein